MDAAVYNARAHRELPRDGECVVSFIFGEAAGPCRGKIHRHHVDPADPGSRTFQICAAHHPSLQAIVRKLVNPRWRRCPHKPGTHRYAGAREACERRLNRELIELGVEGAEAA